MLAEERAHDTSLVVSPEFSARVAGTADGTSGTVDTSSSSGRFDLSAGIGISKAMPDWHLGDPWVMPTLGASVGTDLELIGGGCGECETTWDLIGGLELDTRLLWWDAYYREDYQRPVDFDDDFWRDETGTIRRTIGFDVPGLFQMDNGEYAMGMLTFGWERRELFQAELGSYFSPDVRLGDEYSVHGGLGNGTVILDEESAVRFNVMDFRYNAYITPGQNRAAELDVLPIYQTPASDAVGADGFDLSVLDLQWSRRLPGINRLAVGISVKDPTDVPDAEDGVESVHVLYALSYGQALSRDYVPGWERFGERMPQLNLIGWNVEAKSFHRIDPSGLATDAGHQISGDIAFRPLDPLTLSGRAQVIGAERRQVSSLVTDDAPLSAKVGDWFIMGRVEAQAEWDFGDMFSVLGNAWVEHSDRADVNLRRDITRGVLPLDSNYGVWLGLSFHPL